MGSKIAMLTALLIIGGITAVATPIVVFWAIRQPTGAQPEDARRTDGSKEDDAWAGRLERGGGQRHSLSAEGGILTLDRFVAGVDRVTIAVDTLETEFHISPFGVSGTRLSYTVGGAHAELRFPNLSELPAADIQLLEPEGNVKVPAPRRVMRGPDRRKSPRPGRTDRRANQDRKNWDGLLGTEPAPAPPSSAPQVREIASFVPGDDILHLTLVTDLPEDAIALEFATSDCGSDSIVRANGETLAIVRGVPEVGRDDLVLEIERPGA
ncbi:MAG: hypothetical protein AAF771_07565 [Pseudomonadota bacterium]